MSASSPCQAPAITVPSTAANNSTTTNNDSESVSLDSKILDDFNLHVGEKYQPPAVLQSTAHIKSLEQYKLMYQSSIQNPNQFWSDAATQLLSWFSPFTTVSTGSFTVGDISWFLNGKLNVSYNCIDRHLHSKGDNIAIISEGDNPATDIRKITYNQLSILVNKFANVLLRRGVVKGDCVCIYLPNIIEAAVAMLACTRIGAIHSVVFAGFSAEALSQRILDGNINIVITADAAKRAGKLIPLKSTVDQAIANIPTVCTVIVYSHTNTPITMQSGRDYHWNILMAAERPYCPPIWMDSEDPLFTLYTSGSTGKAKGLLHTTAGYLLYAGLTCQYTFDLHDSDIHFCAADVGWVTGHSYIVYGPLLLGCTTVMLESTPLYPDAGRYWSMIERHQVTTFYTAPTAIRALMKFDNSFVQKYDRSTLRIIGSVGEPINPESFRWYYDIVGERKCALTDTYWQTETGGHIITPMPAAIATKPGSATLPFFGIEPVVLDPQTGVVLTGNNVSGVLAIGRPWPGIARTIYNDHERYLQTYMTQYPNYYFTGDGCMRDSDGYYWITGRVDDVVNVSGHRIGSAEIESALVTHKSVAEAAVIGIAHSIKGQSLFAAVITKNGIDITAGLVSELKYVVREVVGSFAVPDEILITAALPKTRSGKIMRRLLRKIATNDTETLGDISTLADESVVEKLISEVALLRSNNASKK